MKTINLLILEDDIKTLSVLLDYIAKLEDDLSLEADIDITIFSNYKQVENVVNKQEANTYDIILLDRDCKMCGSFHILDIEKFGPENIISISSTPQWNAEAQERGVQKIILKDFSNLDSLGQRVIEEIKQMI